MADKTYSERTTTHTTKIDTDEPVSTGKMVKETTTTTEHTETSKKKKGGTTIIVEN